jgi:hypothetical protein
VAASASPSSIPSRPPTAEIEITPSTRVINLGGTFVISVRFLARGADRRVILQSQPGYTAESDAANNVSWTYLATLVTDAIGNATFTDSPPDSRYYRVTFAGAPDLGAATSSRARALVRQVYALEPTNNGQIVNVARGTVVQFTSTVRPVRPLAAPAKATFVVYQHLGDAWVLVASYDTTIDAAGHARFSYTFSRPGAFYVRSVARPTPENANSTWTPLERYDVG